MVDTEVKTPARKPIKPKTDAERLAELRNTVSYLRHREGLKVPIIMSVISRLVYTVICQEERISTLEMEVEELKKDATSKRSRRWWG